MDNARVLFETNGAICTITINRPERRNAVDGPTAVALRTAFEKFETDDALRVAVLAGAGDSFCAGADLKSLGNPDLRNEIEPTGHAPGPMGPSRMILDKPLIGAIQGYAVAGGLELALLCDMRVAEESATFGVFCRRWGVPLIDGGTVRLPRVVGQGVAMDMILTGRPVSADEAKQIGLANRVVPDGQALVTAQEIARQIAEFPQECMKADRRSAYAQWDYTFVEALAREGAGGYQIVFDEAISGAKRFADGAGRHGSFKTLD